MANVDNLFATFDADGSGGISFAEFQACVKLGGGKSFEKAISAVVMHDGAVLTWEQVCALVRTLNE